MMPTTIVPAKRRLWPPCRLALALMSVLALATCDGSDDSSSKRTAAPEDATDEVIAHILPHVPQPAPTELFALLGGLPEERPVASLEETKSGLRSDVSLEPIASALRAAGYDDDEAARLVAIAGAFNSGTKADWSRARTERLHLQFNNDLQPVDDTIAKAEAKAGQRVDRSRLYRTLYAPRH